MCTNWGNGVWASEWARVTKQMEIRIEHDLNNVPTKYHISKRERLAHLCYSFFIFFLKKELCHCAWPNYYRLIIWRERSQQCDWRADPNHFFIFEIYSYMKPIPVTCLETHLNGAQNNQPSLCFFFFFRVSNVLAVLGYDCANIVCIIIILTYDSLKKKNGIKTQLKGKKHTNVEAERKKKIWSKN